MLSVGFFYGRCYTETVSRKRPIYLDHHSTTPVDARVSEVMLPWLTERFGNAASIGHVYGDEAHEAVEAAREQVAALVNCTAREVIFTSGATEADNLALKGLMWSSPAGSRLVINAGEHNAVLDPADRLSCQGYDVTTIGIDETGQVNVDELSDAIRDDTRLVSAMFANNEVGTINPVAEIGRLCRERGVRFHCDAVQAAGLLPVDLQQLPIDLLSLSAHKIYGPQGVGALIVRRNRGRIPLTPLIDGGGHEHHLRSGTLPVALIAGFGEACRFAREEKADDALRLSLLRDRLWAGLQASLDGLHRNGHPDDCLPNNLNLSVEGVDGEALLMNLTAIAVSSGAACSSADPEPSHVLRAMGVSEELTRASLRFGLGRGTTQDDIDVAIAHVTEVVKRLRGE
jgi:cysteine desulfurase